MDFATRLSISTNSKSKTYNSILVVVNWLIKMIYYKPVKIIIDALTLVKFIIKTVMRQYGLLDSIMSNQGLIFISKFYSSLYYSFQIKEKLLTAFHLQTNSQIERQNSIIKAYFQTFANLNKIIGLDLCQQPNSPITMLNTPARVIYVFRSLELLLRISYKNDVNLESQVNLADKLTSKLRE